MWHRHRKGWVRFFIWKTLAAPLAMPTFKAAARRKENSNFNRAVHTHTHTPTHSPHNDDSSSLSNLILFSTLYTSSHHFCPTFVTLRRVSTHFVSFLSWKHRWRSCSPSLFVCLHPLFTAPRRPSSLYSAQKTPLSFNRGQQNRKVIKC